MSTLIQLSAEISTQVLSAHPGVTIPMAADGEGILDWLTAKNTQTQSVLRGVAVTLGIIFVIIQAVASRGAMARIIVSLIAAGIFIWGVWSVTDIKDRVQNEFGTGSTVIQADSAAVTAPGPLTFPFAV